MKHIFKTLIAIIAMSSLFSCEPTEDRTSLPAIDRTAADLHFAVTPSTSNPNKVEFKNLDTDVIPYWSYTDAVGNEIAHYNTNNVAVTLPFAGTYYVNYTAYVRGGAVPATPVKVVIKSNDASYFSNPKWNLLTNGVGGKTWVLDMVAPMGFAAGNYTGPGTGDWNWFPDLASNGWIMENKDWGQMYFDLNGGYHTTVKQTSTAGGSNAQTTKSATFTFDTSTNKIIFNGGVQLLYGGTYDVPNYSSGLITELTANYMSIGVFRSDGVLLVYHYIPKP